MRFTICCKEVRQLQNQDHGREVPLFLSRIKTMRTSCDNRELDSTA